jgi:aldehyde:ferredoxin oxidoreductase
MTVLEEGPTEGSLPDMDMMLGEFYALRGFDEQGIPTRKVLEDAGLPELAEILHRA